MAYPSPYPYPYQYQPVPVAPPQPSTPKGVGWCVRAFMLHLVALVMLALAGVAGIAVIGGLQPGQNPFQMLALFLPVLLLLVAWAVIEIVVLVFYLVGFGYVYKGRNEFGPAHARNLRIALYLLILAFVLGLASIVTTTVMSSFAIRMDPFGGTFTFEPGLYYATQAVGIGFGIVIAAFVAAHLVLAIRVLAKPQHERLLYAAAAIGTATPGVAGALLLLVLPRYLALLTDAGAGLPIGPETGLPGIAAAGVSVVTFLLFLLAFRGAEARLRSGELKPTLPPPQVTSWMPAPVVPYAPYGPYAPQTPVAPPPPPQPPPSPPGA